LLSGSHVLSGRRWLDGLLLVLLAVTVFLLGCYEMGDSDIWWHLRGGQWILEHGRVPDLDPFTFGSADKPWVDIHWSYEVILVLAYRAGGAAALVFLGAAVGAAAFLTVLTARRRDWPVAASVLCWMPTLVLLSFRLDPRPEIFSLLYLGCYLAVLWRVEERPALAWLLPLVQLLWVNVQGLFILGPILLGMFLAANGARLLWRYLLAEPRSLQPDEKAKEKRWWLHVGGATFTAAVVCLANPYFFAGAWFPFELFPKVADPNNPYKKYIDELMSPMDFVRRSTPRVAGANWFFLVLYFLLRLLPLSFLYPAVWRAWQEPRPTRKKARQAEESSPAPRTGAWLGGLAVIIALLVVNTLTVSENGPAWLNAFGDNVPLVILLGGGGAALLFGKGCPPAAALAGVGGVALAACMVWLDAAILGGGRGLLAGSIFAAPMTVFLLIAGGIAGALVLRSGGNLFCILLAGAFSYLALQALQNWSRFALVAGAVLTWNFAAWAGQLMATERTDKSRTAAAWVLRACLALALAAWIAALAGDRYYVHTGEPRHFAFREEPLAFAHDAALFAGQPGLPDRALVYGLDQACVYVYHNAPRCKPYMDGRLEMPDLRTFQTYAAIEDWLQAQDPRWEKAVREMGDPLLLLDHQRFPAAEARLMIHPGWRCVYFDALASVFVPRGRGISSEEFASVDFAARHFRQPARPCVPDVKGAAAREVKSLFNLAAALPRSPEVTWRWRIPVLLAALDRAGLALHEDPARPDVWVHLGNCYWILNPSLHVKPPTPAEEWSLETGIWWAQATYCMRQALERQPDHPAAWRYLYQAYRVREMADAQSAAGQRWADADPKVSADERQAIRRLREKLGQARVPAAYPREQLPTLVAQLLTGRRPETAARLLDAAEQSALAWPFAERAAGLYMHLGPLSSHAANQKRGDLYVRQGEHDRAIADYTQAIRLNPYGALTCVKRGDAYRSKGEYDRALADYTNALQLDPLCVVAHINRAATYRLRGQNKLALVDLTQATRLDAINPALWYERALTHRALNQFEEALADFDRAIGLNPADPDLYYQRGYTHQLHGDTAAAFGDFDEAIRRKPDFALVYHGRGCLHVTQDNLEAGIADFGSALRFQPDFLQAYMNRASAWSKMGRFDKALQDCDEALRREPRLAAAYLMRGRAYVQQGAYPEADADFERVLQLEPDNAQAYQLRGLSALKQGQHDKALGDLAESLKRDPDNARTLFLRGTVHQFREQHEQALADFQKAVLLDPQYTAAYCNQRAMVHVVRGEYELALADFAIVLHLDPTNLTALMGRDQAQQALRACPPESPGPAAPAPAAAPPPPKERPPEAKRKKKPKTREHRALTTQVLRAFKGAETLPATPTELSTPDATGIERPASDQAGADLSSVEDIALGTFLDSPVAPPPLPGETKPDRAVAPPGSTAADGEDAGRRPISPMQARSVRDQKTELTSERAKLWAELRHRERRAEIAGAYEEDEHDGGGSGRSRLLRRTAVVLLAVVVLSSTAFGVYSLAFANRAIRLTAAEAWQEYAQNTAEANKKYRGKWVRVTGRLKVVTDNKTNNKTTQLFFEPPQEDAKWFISIALKPTDAKDLKPGEEIILLGRFNARKEPDGNLPMSNCSLVKDK
jgi:tetratricopeptide (TPR) repeat protein